jgi:hypothetical protein
VIDVETFVALQPDEGRPQRRGQDFRNLGLPDSRFAFEEEGPPQSEREVDRNCEPAFGNVMLTSERLLQLIDRGRNREWLQVRPSQRARLQLLVRV